MTTPDSNRGSEYGGAPGLIQPPPHDVADSASEMLSQIYKTNPAGDTSIGRAYVPDENDPFVPDTRRLR